MMGSIYRQAMGSDFDRLHPRIQRRFGFDSASGYGCVGTGVMDHVWYGRPYTLPFLYIGTWRNIMFPQQGRDVPFTIENYAYRDRFGRETVTWTRTYRFPRRTRRFDATMVYSERRERIVDYLGTHQHLAVDIDLQVDARTGGLRLRSGAQRFYEGPVGFNFPMLFSGIADVCEWYDEATNRFKIDVRVHNRAWGNLFGYRGSFEVAYKALDGGIPAHVRPLREERRE